MLALLSRLRLATIRTNKVEKSVGEVVNRRSRYASKQAIEREEEQLKLDTPRF